MSKSIAVRSEARDLSVASSNELTSAVTAFGQYTDPSGVAATSPAGLMKSFNNAVKREFGLPVDAMTQDMQLHVASLRIRVATIIKDGMESRALRADIKRMIRESVKVSASAYQMMVGGSRDNH